MEWRRVGPAHHSTRQRSVTESTEGARRHEPATSVDTATRSQAEPHGWLGTETLKTHAGEFAFKNGYPAGDTAQRLRERSDVGDVALIRAEGSEHIRGASPDQTSDREERSMMQASASRRATVRRSGDGTTRAPGVSTTQIDAGAPTPGLVGARPGRRVSGVQHVVI